MMNILRRAIGFISAIVLLLQPLESVSADALDDAIAALRSGIVDEVDEARWNEIQASSRDRAVGNFAKASAELYSDQVKWSLIDRKNHGGWPSRSFLIHQETTRHLIYGFLKADYEKAPSPIKAYTLMCFAMLAKDEALIQALEASIATDMFLFQALQQNRPLWRISLPQTKEE